MVIDHLDNAARYASLHPVFEKAFEFLRGPAAEALKPGRNEIDGDVLYAMSIGMESRPAGNDFLEFHRRYIDIHYTLEGEDVMGWRPTALCEKVRQEYEEASDAGLFDDASFTRAALPPGTFCIVYPEDAHAPLIGEGFVRKIVLKILV